MIRKLVVLTLGLFVLRWLFTDGRRRVREVRLSTGRVVRVLKARHDPFPPHQDDDPDHVHGPRFEVAFAADGLSRSERAAIMPELAVWAAALPEARGCGRVMVQAAEQVVVRRLWWRYLHAEWAEFRRTSEGHGVELLRDPWAREMPAA